MSIAALGASESEEDRRILLQLLFDHKRELIVSSLRDIGDNVRKSISVPDLRSHINEALDNGTLQTSQLAGILNNLEGWGNQQVYLYKFEGSNTTQEEWSQLRWVEEHFDRLNKRPLLNNTRPIVLPVSPTLVSVQYYKYGDNREPCVRFIWVEKRTSLERAEELDPEPGDVRLLEHSTTERIIFQAFREITVRGVISFDWNIQRCEAMLMLYKLSGTNYAVKRDALLPQLREFIPINDFRPVPISSLVTRIRSAKNEVLSKALSFQTINNEGILTLSSGDQDEDIFADAVLEQAHTQVANSVTGLSGNIRWKLQGSQHISVEIYGRFAEDQRIGIGSEQSEADIRYVLQRIRTYCT